MTSSLLKGDAQLKPNKKVQFILGVQKVKQRNKTNKKWNRTNQDDVTLKTKIKRIYIHVQVGKRYHSDKIKSIISNNGLKRNDQNYRYKEIVS